MRNFACFKKILVFLIFGCHALFAQTVPLPARYTFYFLPPNEDVWIAGNSYLYNVEADTAGLMRIDATRCGWFKMEFTSLNRIPEKAMIYLGSQGRDKLDTNGKADPLNPAWIPLREKFGTSSSLYLIADGMLFTTTRPGDLGEEQQNRCSYKMAAFIYDTDSSVNPSFNGNYRAPSTANNGIRRKIVAPDLDTTTRKPTFVAAKGYANWVDAESFNAAFTPKGKYNNKIANIPRCYDMPFSRVANGTWEFDSDRTHPPNSTTNLVGGFYPYILDRAYSKDEDGTPADYTDCPNCNKEYTANCFNTLTANNVPQVNYKGITYRGIEAFDRTYFADGANIGQYYDYGSYGCDAPRPGFDGAKKSTANLSFCFESHEKFIYEKGQEFFFRGDDDIWVFINNRLVIDLGGVHMPAPGFVDLDTIKTPEPLVEGNTYPIDVFFCERLGTQSNVRVSTNMYIVQKSNFYKNEEGRDGNWMCISRTGGATCADKISDASGSGGVRADICGRKIVDSLGYEVDFYMIRRGSLDTVQLSGIKNTKDCKGTNKAFTCFEKDGGGGIKVDSAGAVYFCGGWDRCKGRPAAAEKVNVPPGSYTIYSRLMDPKTSKPVQGSKPLIIDNITSTTNVRIVWGNLNTDDGRNPKVLPDAYGKITKKEQFIIAEKRTPIYIAGGKWKANGTAVDTSYTSFVYENDSELVANVKYVLTGATGLKITLDSLGEKEVEWPRGLPQSGIDTLWVMGYFSMGEKEFEINVVESSAETPSLKLTVYQPTLRFTDTDSTITPVNPASPNTASGFTRWTNGDPKPPYVGRALELYVLAWDPYGGADGKGAICSHCDFLLRETSSTNNDSINAKWPDIIVQSNAGKMKEGRQTILIRGKDAVEDTSFAKWRVYGPSEGTTFAEWTGLQFRPTLIPMPLESYVYDRNGDGIGDSLRITFSKSFRENGVIVDSLLPILIEVTWEKGNTVPYHVSKYKADDLKKKDYVVNNLYSKAEFFKENREYWEKYLVGDSVTMIIAEPTTAFSKSILTSGKGSLLSYTPFYEPDKCVGGICKPTDITYDGKGSPASVLDRIPPIVVEAEYKMDKTKNCGADKIHGCKESLLAYLSEPIFSAPNAADDHLLIKNPFSYCFEYSQHTKCLPPGTSVQRSNLTWNTLDWKWELPQEKSASDTSHLIYYKPNTKKPYPKEYSDGVTKGDSIVDITYLAYRIGEGSDAPTTRMPKATDWIKIRPPSSEAGRGGIDVFFDAEGNTANPKELGVLISGENYSRKKQVKIAVINPDISPDDPASTIGGTFAGERDRDKYYPKWINEEAKKYGKENLYQPGKVAEFLPLPPSKIPNGGPQYTDPDTIKAYYPGSVGTLFDDYYTVGVEAQDIWKACEGKGCKTKEGKPINSKEIVAETITMHASVYYHTNIGDYTAHRDPLVAKCTDKIFLQDAPSYSDRGNNCWGNENNIYLAWDLKTNKDRYAGVGAYAAITTFYWLMEYIDAKGNLISNKVSERKFVEMFGVRRGK